ncbi:MAG UNVERIFIED_CONTAM: hypothetical protein LVQ98_05890 [Rickettsiaceae bacterium]|jgi:hypothetical protein
MVKDNIKTQKPKIASKPSFSNIDNEKMKILVAGSKLDNGIGRDIIIAAAKQSNAINVSIIPSTRNIILGLKILSIFLI